MDGLRLVFPPAATAVLIVPVCLLHPTLGFEVFLILNSGRFQFADAKRCSSTLASNQREVSRVILKQAYRNALTV